MNFEFKSTFKIQYVTKSVLLPARAFIQLITRNVVTLLVINLSALCLLGYLYFQNIFIPAVYGSKATGEFWISLFQTSGYIWIISTAYASSVILIQIMDRNRRLFRLADWMNSAVTRTIVSSRITVALLVLIITMIIRVSNYTNILVLSGPEIPHKN